MIKEEGFFIPNPSKSELFKYKSTTFVWKLESRSQIKSYGRSKGDRSCLPNSKIGIMHLAAGIWQDDKDMRLDKSVKIDIYNLQDQKELKSLRFNNS